MPSSWAGAVFLGESYGDGAGASVVGGGDPDADGHPDLLVGANRGGAGDRGPGATYVVHGPVSGTMGLGSADAIISAESVKLVDFFGQHALPAGDYDGDGDPDIVVSAPQSFIAEPAYPGQTYLFDSGLSGEVLATQTDLLLVGEVGYDQSGRGQAGGGDLNGDGLRDIVIGAPYNDEAGMDSGKVYVVFGSRDWVADWDRPLRTGPANAWDASSIRKRCLGVPLAERRARTARSATPWHLFGLRANPAAAAGGGGEI